MTFFLLYNIECSLAITDNISWRIMNMKKIVLAVLFTFVLAFSFAMAEPAPVSGEQESTPLAPISAPSGEGNLSGEQSTPSGEGSLSGEQSTPSGEENLSGEQNTPSGEGSLSGEQNTPSGENNVSGEQNTDDPTLTTNKSTLWGALLAIVIVIALVALVAVFAKKD